MNEITPLSTEEHHFLQQAYEYEAKGRFDKAILACKKVLELNPKSAEAYNLLGLVLDHLEQQEEAAKAYQEAIRLDPNFLEAKQNLEEIQVEVHQATTQKLQRKKIILAIRKGALSFGLAFAAIEIWRSFFIYSQWVDSLVIRVIMDTLAFAVGVGWATAVTASRSKEEKALLGRVVGIGCGLVYFMTHIFFLIFRNFWLWFDSQLVGFISIVPFVLMGSVTGALTGIVRKEQKLVIWLVIVGAVGFGFYAWPPPSPQTVLGPSLFMNLISLFGEPRGYFVMYLLQKAMWAILPGILSGGLFGWIVTQGTHADLIEV